MVHETISRGGNPAHLVPSVGLFGSTNETNKPYPHNGYTARSRLPLTHAPSPAQGIFTRMWHSSDVRR